MPRAKVTKTSIKPKIKKAEKDDFSLDVLDLNGKTVDQVVLPKKIMESKVNDKLLAQAVRVYLANQRQGTLSTKTRAEVAGSTRKIYRQKGTGRARHGSIKAPIFVGGGITFGPHPRDFSLKLSKKMRKEALKNSLISKFQEKSVLVVSGLEKMKNKTKEVVIFLKNLGISLKNGKLLEKTLLVLDEKNEKLCLGARNMKNLSLSSVDLLNSYQLLYHQKIIFTKEALKKLEPLWS